MKAVFYGVGAFLLISLWLFFLAFQLVPTDIGNTYLLGAYLFVVGAGLLAGMAFVGKSIVHEIKNLQVMPAPRVIDSEPVVTLPQIPISTLPADEKPAIGTGGIVATAAVATTAGMVAGGLIGGVTRSEAAPAESPPKVEDRFLDDLERDLFADIGKPEPKLFPDRVDDAAIAESQPEPDSETEDAALLTPASEALADTGEGDATSGDDSDGKDDEADEAEEANDDIVAPSEDELQADGSEMAEEDRDDLAAEDDVAPAPMPGLIADDDLAALQDEQPVLAPLDTLEIVGAYDSGGTRFTMYSDGSVTALGQGVDRRFKSLDALRSFIDGGMKS
jgi:hypothetical protein